MFKNTIPSSKKYNAPLYNIDVTHFRRCLHAACNRPFKMNRLMGQASGLTDMGKLVCPYCGRHNPAETNSIYVSQALTASEEREFISWSPITGINS